MIILPCKHFTDLRNLPGPPLYFDIQAEPICCLTLIDLTDFMHDTLESPKYNFFSHLHRPPPALPSALGTRMHHVADVRWAVQSFLAAPKATNLTVLLLLLP